MAMLFFTSIVVLGVLSTDFEFLVKERLTTGLDTGNVEYISSGRTAMWWAAVREMAEYPLSFLTGLGWEAYYQTGGNRYATHSVYLDRLYNLGFIGLTLFLLSYAGAIAIARNGLKFATKEVAPLLIGTIIGMTSFMFAMAFTDIEAAAIYVWAYSGLALRIAIISTDAASYDRLRTRDQT
jgi:O-antigen ligase